MLNSKWSLDVKQPDRSAESLKSLENRVKHIEREREALEKQILTLIMKIDQKVDQIEGTSF